MHWPESTTRRPVRTYSPRIDSIGQKPRALMRGSSGEVAMRTLLIAESALVALAGLPLALFPSTTIFLLLGAELDDQVGTFVGRGAGAALLTLGIACWLARNGRHERATTELIVALLLYDTAVVVVFSFARSAPGLSGIDLWPAVEVHLGLGVCCLVCLGKELRDNYQRETNLAANRQQLKPLIGGSRIGVWLGVHSPSPASGEGARRDEYYSVPDIARPTEKRLTTN
jgi:hypothetical protein